MNYDQKQIVYRIVSTLIGAITIIGAISLIGTIVYYGATNPIVLGYIVATIALLGLLYLFICLSCCLGSCMMDSIEVNWDSIVHQYKKLFPSKPKVWDK